MARSRDLSEFDELLSNGLWKCRVCRLVKPLSEFHKDSSRRSGHCNLCKECDRNKQRKYLTELDRIDPARSETRRARAREDAARAERVRSWFWLAARR